ncbi:hypothetical protein GCM10011575_22340 [Microlunatus endophyticus]|uniref:DUF222 domain-containing protein n=1 Tax=Microlunatus endophyticus TaxID=1716077 RepID=A0A917S9V5_9ACTN|nr:hypothetical protein [Microlunatus endophyticus]GGL63382.1 hypothetical protein GCM10011575_22340 [Microlunatus endophyticus]
MDSASGELDERSVLAAARASMLAEKRAGCDLLLAAAQWADLHPSDSVLSPDERLDWYGEDAVLFGGEGTPDVAETAAGALGVEIGMNPDQARNLIADALDARDRMPGLWTQVRFGRVRRDTVHRVAFRSRHLSKEQAEDIDRHLSGSLPRLTPGQRLDNLLDAQIKRVDQERLEREAAQAIRDRYVRKGRPDLHGMTDLYFHTTEADARASWAAITALATILKARKADLPPGVPVRGAGDGDGDPLPGTDGLDEWRAVASQLLQTNPGLAVRIQLEAQQPGLFDQAVETLTHVDDGDTGGGGPCRDATAGASTNNPDAQHDPAQHDPAVDDAVPGGATCGDAVHDSTADVSAAAAGSAVSAGEAVADGVRADRAQDAASDAVREAVIADLVAGLIKQLDFTKLQPSAILHLHISEESLNGPFGPADPQARLARVEGLGPVYLDTVRQWLGQACTVKLQPIIDTGAITAVDRYEIPARIRETLLTLSPASRFPWSNSLNRHNDLDHTIAYQPPDRGGPPGQTGIDNLGPLTRREHRHKTFGQTAVRQPDPDTHVWKTSYGRVLIVNPGGTFDLGTGNLAQTLWAALNPARKPPTRTNPPAEPAGSESVLERIFLRQVDLIARAPESPAPATSASSSPRPR